MAVLLKALGFLFGFGCLLVAVASVVVLVRIGGKSDGPGAMVFYLGAFFGGGGALAGFSFGFSIKA
jgi:hypothetical protein